MVDGVALGGHSVQQHFDLSQQRHCVCLASPAGEKFAVVSEIPSPLWRCRPGNLPAGKQVVQLLGGVTHGPKRIHAARTKADPRAGRPERARVSRSVRHQRRHWWPDDGWQPVDGPTGLSQRRIGQQVQRPAVLHQRTILPRRIRYRTRRGALQAGRTVRQDVPQTIRRGHKPLRNRPGALLFWVDRSGSLTDVPASRCRSRRSAAG